jgi:hypothetical protein
VSTVSPPEYQSRRVLIDVFDRLVQPGKGTAPIDGEGLELLEAGIGKAREPGRDLVRALVEIFRELANCVGGPGDLTAAVAASGEVFESSHDLIETLRILRQRRGHGLDVVQRAAERGLVLGDEAVDPGEDPFYI